MSIYKKGIDAEAKCAALLASNGYNILHRRLKSIYGEIDIVANKDDCLYIVEVKYRHLSLCLAKLAVAKSVRGIEQAYLAVLYDQYPNLYPRFKYFAMSRQLYEFGDIDIM